jgi:hypothetical protein
MKWAVRVRVYGQGPNPENWAGKILDCELHVLLNDLQYYWDLKWDHKYSKWIR